MNTANNTTGSSYTATRDLDIAEIAKLVRADIKAMKIAGLVCSVKISRYAGGQSLNVYVTKSPVQIWADDFVAADRNSYFDGDRYTAEASALIEKLDGALQAYNYDRSDIQSDYFSVRFYGRAEFGTDLSIADRETTAARLQVAA